MSLSKRQRNGLMEHVYRALRDYQTGAAKGDSTAIGQLTVELTAVYDRIRAHIPVRKNGRRT